MLSNPHCRGCSLCLNNVSAPKLNCTASLIYVPPLHSNSTFPKSVFWHHASYGSSCYFLSPSDALPVAVQPAGEAATAKMVHATNRAGEEKGDPGHDDDGVGSSAALLQLSPVEGPQDRLQEVARGVEAARWVH